MDKIWISEYCKEQNAFHVIEFQEMIYENNKLIRGFDSFPNYIPFAFSNNEKDAIKKCNEMREFVNE